MGRALRASWALSCFLVGLLVTLDASAESFDPKGADWEGYADFVAMAHQKLGDAFVVVPSVNFSDLRSEDALLLVHPERRLDVDSLAAFMSSGGRIVLLDDFGTGDGLLRRFGIKRVATPSDPALALRKKPDLAIAVPASDRALVFGVDRVVTNHASALDAPSLTPLLEIQSRGGGGAVVGLLGIVSRGALLVVSDPSALMNSMLRYPGNQRVGENLITWASSGRDGHRSGVVYLAHGAFAETGRFSDSANDGGTDVHSNERRASQLVGEFWGPTSLGPQGAHVLAAIVGLCVVVWIGSRAGRTYRIVRPRLTRSVPLFLQGGVAGRAAAIVARTGNRDQALLELGKALEEDLKLWGGLDPMASHETLLHRLSSKKSFDAPSLRDLREFFSRVAHIETLTSAARGDVLAKVRDRELLAAARLVKGALEKAHAGEHEEQAA